MENIMTKEEILKYLRIQQIFTFYVLVFIVSISLFSIGRLFYLDDKLLLSFYLAGLFFAGLVYFFIKILSAYEYLFSVNALKVLSPLFLVYAILCDLVYMPNSIHSMMSILIPVLTIFVFLYAMTKHYAIFKLNEHKLEKNKYPLLKLSIGDRLK